MSANIPDRTIWTVGHSTRTMDDFAAMLIANRIELLADVRRFPGSRRHPHFGQDALRASLSESGISYEHLPELGGRRVPRPDSINTAWQNASFRGYADYMESSEFPAAVDRLRRLAETRRTAVMCSEALWWRCHRALISDFLKAEGWQVIHIFNHAKTELHPFTSAARIQNGRLSYAGLIAPPGQEGWLRH